jgi:ABC-type multidrug transport system fused ATPase/permease subunit
MALLGEMPNIKNEAYMNGKVFYVSQEPWIFSATIKQNIIFGKPYNKIKFNEIVEVCALKEVSLVVEAKAKQRGKIELDTSFQEKPIVFIVIMYQKN